VGIVLGGGSGASSDIEELWVYGLVGCDVRSRDCVWRDIRSDNNCVDCREIEGV
jgi:hypothetical protein